MHALAPCCLQLDVPSLPRELPQTHLPQHCNTTKLLDAIGAPSSSPEPPRAPHSRLAGSVRALEHPRRWCAVRRRRKIMGKSMDVLSWASLAVTGSTLQTFFFIYGCFTALFSKTSMRHTVRRQWIYLKWSLQALWEGKWPDHDPFRGSIPTKLTRRTSGGDAVVRLRRRGVLCISVCHPWGSRMVLQHL